MGLKSINSTKRRKKRVDLTDAYLRMITDAVVQLVCNDHTNRDALKKLVFCAIKRFNLIPTAREFRELQAQFQWADSIKKYMAQLTPRELETVFPIEKRFDGDRWEIKDYFFTRKVIEEIGLDNEIGDKVDDIVWDYQNPDIRRFGVNTMSVVSALTRCRGEKDPLERWLEDKGVPIYRRYTDQQGREFLTDKDGNLIRIKPKKRVPRHWKVIEGGVTE